MQSDGNSFCGDVVLDDFKMSYKDEDSILGQKREKKMGSLSWRFYILEVIEENEYLKK